MQEKLFGIPWMLWGCVALVVAAAFAFVVPNSKIVPTTAGIQFVVLRWFHALVWVLLALMCVVRGFLPGSLRLANGLGLLSLAAYIVFLVTVLLA